MNRKTAYCKNNNMVLKTYNSIIEQLGICTVRSKHKDNANKCMFFVVPGDSPALLGLPDIEMLDIL